MTGVIERYRQWLDLPDVPAVTLGEGQTPLVHWDTWGNTRIYLKLEGCNPTGSFKDRGMTVAVSVAKHRGARAVICASTGNTAASAAAFAGRAGLLAFVVVPQGQVSAQKMIQAAAHGARVLAVAGNFDQALATVRQTAAENDSWLELVNSVNPWRLRGQETGAYEIVDALGHAPAALVLPVGNAGNISAYFQGFRRYRQGIPRMLGIQARGADPLVQGNWIQHPKTIASAIRIGHPASAHLAQEAVKQSQGFFTAVEDDQILEAQAELAHGGVFVEPASASAYAGARKLFREGRLPDGDVALILTGAGLKDTETPQKWARLDPTLTDAQTIGATILSVVQQV